MNEVRIKAKVWPHIVIAGFVLLLMTVVLWGLYLREDAPEPGTTDLIITAAVFGIGAIILFFIVRILINRPDVIYINEHGFSYNPGGVSSGFIPWENVAEIKMVNVNTTQGSLPGPVLETAIGIKLKDPEKYRIFSSPLFRPLLKLNKSMYDVDLFIRISDLGEQREEAMRLLQKFGKTGRLNLPF